MVQFQGSRRYQALLLPAIACARDTLPFTSFPWSERHLRCVWADASIRPPTLASMDGRMIAVIHPGRWNLEAGPDFLNAILRIGPDACTVRGDIELHIRPMDWRRHKHAADPRYKNVIAHITYFEGLLPLEDMPGSVLQIPLRPALRLIPSFSFDGIDVSAYPLATLAPNPPCALTLKTWTPEERGALLDSAGEERLRLKMERMAKNISDKGRDQVLYEEFMGALGYKHNRLAFLQLAQTLPLERLRQVSGDSPHGAYALLLGVAGLLPAQSDPLWDAETRHFIRSLWDIWWKHQSEWTDMILAPERWTLSSLRPANNPLRRLMAAAHLFTPRAAETGLFSEIKELPETLCRTWVSRLQEVGAESYWAWRGSLSKPRHEAPEALIGPGRAASILTNILIPWWAATNSIQADAPLLKTLPMEDQNRFIKHTAHALFGHDHSPALYNSGLRQQGLLQIFHDFCLSTRNDCAECALPGVLSRPG